MKSLFVFYAENLSDDLNKQNTGKDGVSADNATDDESINPKDVALSEIRVTLMPEYLLVCCWRSIKEVSLLLAHIISHSPVIQTLPSNPTDPALTQTVGLISVEQVCN